MDDATGGTMESGTRSLVDADLTRAAVASFAEAPDERLREIVQSLVSHLHAFASEVRLTEEEWLRGIDFLTRTGHMCDDRRQEFILLSDVLGLSMLVVGINHATGPEATESTVMGPFFVEGSPRFENGDDLGRGAPGTPCLMHGQVRSVDGEPIADARIEVWQADEDGFYDVQYADLGEPRGRGHLFSDADGRYSFWSVRPECYGVPDDGPVGELLHATGRGIMRPAHVHFRVSAPGFHTVTTHVFVEGDEHLERDAVFGVRSSLIRSFEHHEAGTAADGRVLDVPYYTMAGDIVLEPAGDRVAGAR